jgi:hypothetical protein
MLSPDPGSARETLLRDQARRPHRPSPGGTTPRDEMQAAAPRPPAASSGGEKGADYGSSTVTANAGHPRSTLREAARGWPVSRRSPEGMWGRKERAVGARYLHAVTIAVPGVLHTCEIA